MRLIAEAVAPHTAPFTPSEYYGAKGQLIKRLGALPPRDRFWREDTDVEVVR